MTEGIHRRPKGTGGIHYRASDGLWLGTVDLGYAGGKRNRRVVSSKSRAVCEAKVAALLSLPAELIRPATPRGSLSRADALAKADARATHTTEQWMAKRDAVGCCVYCGISGPLTVDHATPLCRGGSNGIKNIVPACFACNSAKANRTAAEFIRERALGLA